MMTFPVKKRINTELFIDIGNSFYTTDIDGRDTAKRGDQSMSLAG